MSQDRLDIARDELELALDLAPRDSNANHSMAMLQLRLNNRETAERHFRTAINSDPANFRARNDYGSYLCAVGKTEQGVAQFEAALVNPLNEIPQISSLGAGLCYVEAEDWEQAREKLVLSLSRDPDLKGALYQMAAVSFAQGQYLSARGYLQRFFADGSKTADSLFLAVRNEQKLGAQDLVDEYAQQLRASFPASPKVQELRTLLDTGTSG